MENRTVERVNRETDQILELLDELRALKVQRLLSGEAPSEDSSEEESDCAGAGLLCVGRRISGVPDRSGSGTVAGG